jgi:hypothetical protein
LMNAAFTPCRRSPRSARGRRTPRGRPASGSAELRELHERVDAGADDDVQVDLLVHARAMPCGLSPAVIRPDWLLRYGSGSTIRRRTPRRRDAAGAVPPTASARRLPPPVPRHGLSPQRLG